MAVVSTRNEIDAIILLGPPKGLRPGSEVRCGVNERGAAVAKGREETGRKHAPYRPWDAEGDARLVSLLENGATLDEIAAEVERTGGSIAARLVRLDKVVGRESARKRQGRLMVIGEWQ